MSELTINENGQVLTKTIEGVTMPIDFSFAAVNDFVHSQETHFECLQCLCLGMASAHEQLEKESAALKAEPTTAMIDAGVAFALNVCLSGDYTWSQYVKDLYMHMNKHREDYLK